MQARDSSPPPLRGRTTQRRRERELASPTRQVGGARPPVPGCARPVAARGREARNVGAARRRRCLPLARPRPPPGAVGGEGPERGRAAAALFLERDARSWPRARRGAARDGAVGARRQRLPDAAALAQSPPHELPALPFRRAARARLRGAAHLEGRRLRLGRRRRARAPAPGLGQGRGVHDHRGRERHRQRGRLGKHAGALPQGGDGRALDRRARTHPAPRGHHPRRLGAAWRIAATGSDCSRKRGRRCGCRSPMPTRCCAPTPAPGARLEASPMLAQKSCRRLAEKRCTRAGRRRRATRA